MFLIALPGWTAPVIVLSYLAFVIFAIVCVLKYEQKPILRVVFSLMSILIPLFCVGYVIYALSYKKNNVAI